MCDTVFQRQISKSCADGRDDNDEVRLVLRVYVAFKVDLEATFMRMFTKIIGKQKSQRGYSQWL